MHDQEAKTGGTFAQRLASVEENLASHERQLRGTDVAREIENLREDVTRLLAQLGMTAYEDMSKAVTSEMSGVISSVSVPQSKYPMH